MNNSFGSLIGSLIVLVVIFLLYLPPLIKILRKAGYSGWWVLVSFVPIANIIMIWVFAFANWPSLGRSQPPASQL